MPDHFSLKLKIKSVVMFPVGLLLFFALQSNLFCFLTPASFHRHISISGDTKNYANNSMSLLQQFFKEMHTILDVTSRPAFGWPLAMKKSDLNVNNRQNFFKSSCLGD